jgi:hypothetical protein
VVRAQIGGDEAPYDSAYVDGGCDGCSLSFLGNELEARIAGAPDHVDTAYAVRDFGGRSGWPGAVAVRDTIRLPATTPLGGHLVVLQVRDTRDALVFEIYVRQEDRTLRLFSPEGGLSAESLNASTEVELPADGRPRRLEVVAEPGVGVLVVVDGRSRLELSDLEGARTRPQRYLRVGALSYNGVSQEPVVAYHADVEQARAEPLADQ